jgi:Sigma-54 interaction domain
METQRRPRADEFSNILSADQLAHARGLIPSSELDVLVRYHPNLLIVGKESAVAPTVLALMSDFYRNVYRWPEVPDGIDSGVDTTLIVSEVGCLTSVSLDRLVQWLDTSLARVQIVSTSSTSLLERVQAGAFPASLYYRLNTVLLAVDR